MQHHLFSKPTSLSLFAQRPRMWLMRRRFRPPPPKLRGREQERRPRREQERRPLPGFGETQTSGAVASGAVATAAIGILSHSDGTQMSEATTPMIEIAAHNSNARA
jgi:hypothetical protein